MSAVVLAQLEEILSRATDVISKAPNAEGVEQCDVTFLGRKNGELTAVLKMLSSLDPESKKTVGARANQIKNEIESMINARRREFAALSGVGFFDISEPLLPRPAYGALHPITEVRQNLEAFFRGKGFLVLDGPELESEFYNFEALNIPADHPARDMQDTFYIKDHPTLLMRTHTSGMQVRALEMYGAPLAAVVPGRCFRNEATDVRHEHTFYQFEGFVVGENVTLAHLKGTLEAAAQHLYGPKTQVRLRPKFYPFVEPGMNGEVTCVICAGQGCKLCKGTGWLEIFGCGMIHPEVLKAAKLDPKKVSGFAFGLGLTRIAMLKYGVGDVREFNAGDLNFLQQ